MNIDTFFTRHATPVLVYRKRGKKLTRHFERNTPLSQKQRLVVKAADPKKPGDA
jgi:hypothetical protein